MSRESEKIPRDLSQWSSIRVERSCRRYIEQNKNIILDNKAGGYAAVEEQYGYNPGRSSSRRKVLHTFATRFQPIPLIIPLGLLGSTSITPSPESSHTRRKTSAGEIKFRGCWKEGGVKCVCNVVAVILIELLWNLYEPREDSENNVPHRSIEWGMSVSPCEERLNLAQHIAIFNLIRSKINSPQVRIRWG